MTIYHKHHIIPKHMGGSDDPSNLVEVTIEEHANLHKQLWEELDNEEDRIAWLCLSGQITNAEAIILAIKKANTGRKASLETRKRMSESRKGEKNGFFGKKHSNENKKRIKEARLGVKQSEETKAKYKNRSGKNNGFFGKKHSEETKQKMRKPKRKKI